MDKGRDHIDPIDIFLLCRTFFDARTLFFVGQVSKKSRQLFSWPVVRTALHLPVWELPLPLTGADPRWLWFFLNIPSLSFLENTVHEAPIKKAVGRVAQGALRMVVYDGTFEVGVLSGFVIPSMKSKKGTRVVNKLKTTIERPYKIVCKFLNGQPQSWECECPVGYVFLVHTVPTPHFFPDNSRGVGIRLQWLLVFIGFSINNTQWYVFLFFE
jgi:hypothetical protein